VNWAQGYTAEYYMAVVDPVTWRDIARVEIQSGSISRNNEGIRQTGSFVVSEYSQSVEQWVRVWLNTKQNGASDHVALFTGLATTPQRSYDGVRNNSTLTAYSVLKPLEDVLLLRGWYAAKGKNGGDVIRGLLSKTPAPVVLDAVSPALSDHIIAEDNETVLSMIDKILDSMGWRLRVNGAGEIHIAPPPTRESFLFDPNANDMLETQVSVTEDLFAAPNVFAATNNDITAIAKDETAGPLSIGSRGREVWESESSVTLADNETIERYAMRRLKESQDVQKTAQYTRRFLPDLVPGDVVNLRYPAQELNGLFEVTGQNITLGFAARTQEDVKKWTASIN